MNITLNNMEMDRLFETLLDGLEQNAGLDEKRILVNSILPVDKYTLLQRILSYEEQLNEEIRLNCLPIFFDENTKYISFVQFSDNQTTIKSIMELIPKHCLNIETIDFISLWIKPENKENFKFFLKQTTNMKSLRVTCLDENSAIRQLLLEEDFAQHDADVQNGLLKIDYINGIELSASDCAKLLNLLPKLTSVGPDQELGPLIYSYIDDNLLQKLHNLIEFYIEGTNLNTLEHFVRICQKAKKIFLYYPTIYSIEILSRFPELVELVLIFPNLDQISECITSLQILENQIKYLTLRTPDNNLLDPNIFPKLFPRLVILEINSKKFFFE